MNEDGGKMDKRLVIASIVILTIAVLIYYTSLATPKKPDPRRFFSTSTVETIGDEDIVVLCPNSLVDCKG